MFDRSKTDWVLKGQNDEIVGQIMLNQAVSTQSPKLCKCSYQLRQNYSELTGLTIVFYT